MNEAVRSAIKKIANTGSTYPTIAKVISVNKTENTCVVELEETGEKIPDVMLLCMINNPDKKFVVYPKSSTEEEDSLVRLAFLNNDFNTAIVTCVHNVDELMLHGDEFGGLIKAGALVERLNAIEGKLNDVIGKWNSFCQDYTPGSPAAVGTPPLLTGETLTEIDETTVEPLSNQNVKHG